MKDVLTFYQKTASRHLNLNKILNDHFTNKENKRFSTDKEKTGNDKNTFHKRTTKGL